MANTSQTESPAKVLSMIRPGSTTRRFLQFWDASIRQLWFGCGSTSKGLSVGSRRMLAVPREGVMPTRLTGDLVTRFRMGSAAPNGSELVAELEGMLTRYIEFQNTAVRSLLAVWIMGTYLYTMFSHYGYLFFHSQFKRSGKTRSLELTHHLAFEATVPLNCPTVPAIRDTVACGQTILLDTIAMLTKMVPDGKGVWRRELIPVYAPYVLAAINQDSLDDTALDRSFVIEMQRKSIKVKKARYSYHDCERRCSVIRDHLYLWALQLSGGSMKLPNSRSIWTDCIYTTGRLTSGSRCSLSPVRSGVVLATCVRPSAT
jgi:hypothetical protein